MSLRQGPGPRHRLPALAELITDHAPTVVAVQECPGEPDMSTLARQVGMAHYLAPSPVARHTGLLWHPGLEQVVVGDTYADTYRIGTWNGFSSATLRGPGWPCPLTVVGVHLAPHDADRAESEARFVQSRVRRHGWPGVIIGDINHSPLVGGEPDFERVPVHNLAARTVIDPARPDELRLDRRVGTVLHRAGLTDAAAHRYEQTGNEELLAPTGVHGGIRVDQAWVTSELVPAITGYERLDHRNVTDHHPIAVDLDLGAVAPVEHTPWR